MIVAVQLDKHPYTNGLHIPQMSMMME